ncbi:response regulator [Acanthopleuribacter pedis]|uniref:Response regulator transcription factor n=1 Tax=Acanthopleuribacter pedis TaxID=442870 RepID=A0A8J7U3D6_9BACT|nr:response regulator transcription factor [Acanthopleuribacter pedis]
MIRIVLVDDQPLFREGLKTLIGLQDDMTVVAEAADGRQAVLCCEAEAPDVVLMDINMPQLNGVAATRQIKARFPKVQILMLTTFDDNDSIFDGLRAGAVGYLLKDADSTTLFEAVRSAARGQSVLAPSVASKLISEYTRLAQAPGSETPAATATPDPAPAQPAVDLSKREMEILQQLAKGSGNKEIGAALFIAQGTVKNHITNLFAKLEVNSRLAAVTKARELGLL